MSNPPPLQASFATTLHVRDNCLCLHAQRSARAVTRHFDEAMRPLGLRAGQFSLLISLNRPEPPTIGAVADLLAMDRTTVTAAVKLLDARGLLAVAPDPADRRTRRLVLTPQGRAMLEKAVPVWERAQAALEGRLPQAARLRADLDSLRDAAMPDGPSAS